MPLDVPRGTPKAPLVEVEDLPSWATVHHHVRELSPKTEETPSNVKPFGRIPVGGFPVGAPPILVPRPLGPVRHVRWTTADHGEQDATKFGWKVDLDAKNLDGIPMDSGRPWRNSLSLNSNGHTDTGRGTDADKDRRVTDMEYR